ncbi:MAG: hypothetical protein K6A73_02755 [Bacteroidales bacterium]|nr:hypothetical protein [Bacteroidales bacterium]
MANKIQTIMRTAAMIYAEDQSINTVKSVRRRFVDAVLVNTNNTPHTIEQIITSLQKDYEIVVQEKEIVDFLDDERYYDKVVGKTKRNDTYCLINKRFEKLKEKADYCIDDAIKEFSTQKPDVDSEELRDMLHRYLYTLMNTNISAYTQLLERKGKKVSPVIDPNSFNDEEIEIINSFIKWDNTEKNKALFELVNYCIEYATAINSIDPQDVVDALKNKKLYLDNALIYRALGINGSFRKERVINLLQRCADSGQQLLISSVTRKEFFDTIEYHISHLRGSTPYGRINPSLFRNYTGGYSLYQYYHEWRRTKNVYGFELFNIHIKNEYDALLKRFKILEDFKQQYNDNKDSDKIEQYAEEIKQYKRTKNDSLHVNDAKNMVWVELARNNCDNSVRDTKCYFVTSDRRLQEWDLSHSKNQPITMLPSQWLALLLKYFSRSNDDYKSFVSFLTMPNEKTAVTPDELQDILAGISEITEDFQKQDDIVSELLNSDNSRELRNRIEAQKFAQSHLEAQFKKDLESAEKENQKKLEEQEAASQDLLSKQKIEFEKMLDTIRKERQQDKLERLKDKRDDCKSQLKDKEKLLDHINSNANLKKSIVKWLMISIPVAYAIVMVTLIVKMGWPVMAPITRISSMVLAVITFVAPIILNRDIKFWKIPSEIKNSAFKKQCKKLGFDKNEIVDYQETIKSLEQQILDLEKEVLES